MLGPYFDYAQYDPVHELSPAQYDPVHELSPIQHIPIP